MSDGRIRSGLKKGSSFLNIDPDEVELNTKAGDTNLCRRCYEFIPTLYKNGKRDRSNRRDCEDEDSDLISYHLKCYDLEMFGYVTKTTQRLLDEIIK